MSLCRVLVVPSFSLELLYGYVKQLMLDDNLNKLMQPPTPFSGLSLTSVPLRLSFVCVFIVNTESPQRPL